MEGIIAFVIWVLCGMLFIGFGIAAFSSKKAAGFWANVKVPVMEDVKAYNKAVGRLWCVSGGVFILLGLPLLTGQNSPWILLSCEGVLVEIITMMVVYTRIECKYRKKS